MTFKNDITSTFLQVKKELAAYEKVALIMYVTMCEGGGAEISAGEIKTLSREGRTGVAPKSVPGLLSHLMKKEWVNRSDSGYYLTLDGESKVESLLPEEEPGQATRNDDFITVSDPGDDFYTPLIDDINRCYRAGVNDAVLILLRKLIENLLIDILRGHYGKQQIHLFFVPSQGRFHSFSTLLQNLKDNRSDFKMYYLEIGDLVDEIDEFRENGNASAHSIEVRIPDSRLEEMSPRASKLVSRLLRIKEQIEAAST